MKHLFMSIILLITILKRSYTYPADSRYTPFCAFSKGVYRTFPSVQALMNEIRLTGSYWYLIKLTPCDTIFDECTKEKIPLCAYSEAMDQFQTFNNECQMNREIYKTEVVWKATFPFACPSVGLGIKGTELRTNSTNHQCVGIKELVYDLCKECETLEKNAMLHLLTTQMAQAQWQTLPCNGNSNTTICICLTGQAFSANSTSLAEILQNNPGTHWFTDLEQHTDNYNVNILTIKNLVTALDKLSRNGEERDDTSEKDYLAFSSGIDISKGGDSLVTNPANNTDKTDSRHTVIGGQTFYIKKSNRTTERHISSAREFDALTHTTDSNHTAQQISSSENGNKITSFNVAYGKGGQFNASRSFSRTEQKPISKGKNTTIITTGMFKEENTKRGNKPTYLVFSLRKAGATVEKNSRLINSDNSSAAEIEMFFKEFNGRATTDSTGQQTASLGEKDFTTTGSGDSSGIESSTSTIEDSEIANNTVAVDTASSESSSDRSVSIEQQIVTTEHSDRATSVAANEQKISASEKDFKSTSGRDFTHIRRVTSIVEEGLVDDVAGSKQTQTSTGLRINNTALQEIFPLESLNTTNSNALTTEKYATFTATNVGAHALMENNNLSATDRAASTIISVTTERSPDDSLPTTEQILTSGKGKRIPSFEIFAAIAGGNVAGLFETDIKKVQTSNPSRKRKTATNAVIDEQRSSTGKNITMGTAGSSCNVTTDIHCEKSQNCECVKCAVHNSIYNGPYVEGGFFHQPVNNYYNVAPVPILTSTPNVTTKNSSNLLYGFFTLPANSPSVFEFVRSFFANLTTHF